MPPIRQLNSALTWWSMSSLRSVVRDVQAGLLAIIVIFLAVYFVVIFAPLWIISDRERARYDEIDDRVKSSFRKNLRKRGSIGHLEFLGFETKKEFIVLNNSGQSNG